jgi:hypothetical protein
METITIKENWKAPFVGPSIKKGFKQVLLFMSSCCILMGLFALIYCCFCNNMPFYDGLKQGLFWFLASLLGGPLIMLCIIVTMFPFLLLFSIPKMIMPKIYEFSMEEGYFIIKMNNRIKVDVPLSDFLNCTFVVVTVNRMGGNDLGNSLKLEYLNKDKKVEKEINLSYIFDEDKVRLRHFMAQVLMYKTESYATR